MRKILELTAVLGFMLFTALYLSNAVGKGSEVISIPLFKSDQNIYVSAKFLFNSFDAGHGLFEAAVKKNDEFLRVAKEGSFENIKSFYNAEDGSKKKIEQARNAFSKSRFHKNMSNVNYKHGLAWGKYRFISVDYTSDGRTRRSREDYVCEDDLGCQKTTRDFGQPFEIAYLKFIDGMSNDSLAVKKETESKVDRFFESSGITEMYNVSPPGAEEYILENPYHVTISVKKIKSNICMSCATDKDGLLDHEKNMLKKLVDFRRNIDRLDFKNYDSLLSYVKKFDGKHKSERAFPVIQWLEGVGKPIYVDVRAYFSRILQWQGGIPLGYVASGKFFFVFLRLDDGSAESGFDMEIIVLRKTSDGEYLLLPSGEEGLLDQTFIRDPFVLASLKDLFLN
jgi:hypothetical protein